MAVLKKAAQMCGFFCAASEESRSVKNLSFFCNQMNRHPQLSGCSLIRTVLADFTELCTGRRPR
jgi:hypothetical protein